MYADYGTLPKADLILITHEHPDHQDMKAIQAVSTGGTSIIIKYRLRQNASPGHRSEERGFKTIAGIGIEAVPAYNLEKPFHPKGNGNGYVLTFGINGCLSPEIRKMSLRSTP